MKRLIFLFFVSFFGIILIQILGGLFFVQVPEQYQMPVVISAMVLEFVFYILTIYTLVVGFKKQGGLWGKIFKIFNWLVTLLLTGVLIFYSAAFISTYVNANRYFNKKELEKIPSTAVKAPNVQLVDYNGISKDFILGMRSANLDSNFAKMISYEPKMEIWNGIDKKAGWVSVEKSICVDKSKKCSTRLRGESSLSRLINNPMLVVAPIMIATYHLDEKLPICSDEGLRLVPKAIYLDIVNSKIIIVYPGTKVLTKCKYLQLSGLNARDLGYNWAKVVDKQNILFPFPDNITKKVYEFKDSIITAACAPESSDRCNIYSDIDDKVVFNVMSYPANIELKLWKEKPMFSSKVGDFNVDIRFVE